MVENDGILLRRKVFNLIIDLLSSIKGFETPWKVWRNTREWKETLRETGRYFKWPLVA